MGRKKGKAYRKNANICFINDSIEQLEQGKMVYLYFEHQLNDLLVVFPNADWDLVGNSYTMKLEELN